VGKYLKGDFMKLKGLQLAWFNVYHSAKEEMFKRKMNREKRNVGILVDTDFDALLYQIMDYRSHRACRSLTGGICVKAFDLAIGDVTEKENAKFMANKRKQGIRATKLMRGK
jgi:hypothetical protein